MEVTDGTVAAGGTGPAALDLVIPTTWIVGAAVVAAVVAVSVAMALAGIGPVAMAGMIAVAAVRPATILSSNAGKRWLATVPHDLIFRCRTAAWPWTSTS